MSKNKKKRSHGYYRSEKFRHDRGFDNFMDSFGFAFVILALAGIGWLIKKIFID